jgi:hypothetical protein
MLAFISHLTKDRVLAGRIKEMLAGFEIDAFIAHEDVGVSEEWRKSILNALDKADVFFAVLSEGYFASQWCDQEFGIAAFLQITMVPFSLDLTVPLGFGHHIQSKRITDGIIRKADLIAGMMKHDRDFMTDKLIALVGKSGSFDTANARLDLLEPYLKTLSELQAVKLLTYATENFEIKGSFRGQALIPPLRKAFEDSLSDELLAKLEEMY